MTKNTKPRSASQIARDRRRISQLYLQGTLQVDIADQLGLDQSTISRDLKALHQEWLDSAMVDYDQAKAKELAKIDNLEMTYYQEWAASKEPIVKRKTAKRVNNPGGDGGPDWRTTEATQEISLGTGDPRFLQGVQWCIDRRCKLLGLDAPVKQLSKNIEVNLSELDNSQLKRLAAGEDIVEILAGEG